MAVHIVSMTPDYTQETLKISQNDVGRQLSVYLVDEDGVAYTIPSGATVKVLGTKPSGIGFTVNASFSGSTVTFNTTAEMSGESGNIPCEVRITSGNNRYGSANINLYVEKNPHPDSTTDGTSEEIITAITSAMTRAEDAADSAEASEQRVTSALTQFSDIEDTLDRAQEIADNAYSILDDFEAVTASATTLSAGAQATVNYNNNHFTFGIPTGAQGPQGAKGDKGDTGNTGATPNITVGNVSSGATPSVTKRGTTANAIFDFVFPIYQLTSSDKADIVDLVLDEMENAEAVAM